MLIRPATEADRPFLWEALTLAINWRDGEPHMTPAEVREHPGSSHYVVDWPRSGEAGFVALDPDAVAACWWRMFGTDDRGYGFVDAAIPEIGLAVVPHRRGEGIGSALLEQLIVEATERGLPGISLSVQLDNPARPLYERHGFSDVSRDGSSATMLLRFELIERARSR